MIDTTYKKKPVKQVIIINSKKDYSLLDSLKNSGIDSVGIKSSKINFSYQEEPLDSYRIKK